MEGNFGPVILGLLTCCGGPLLFFGLGYWVALGMPGSPVIISRRNKRPETYADFER